MEPLSEQEMLQILQEKGYNLVRIAQVEDREFVVDTSQFSTGKTFKVGIVSDTHLGSKYQQLTHLKAAYRYMKKRKIKHVLHAGDILAGNGRVYRGQQYELFAHGSDAQRDYVVNYYPREEGMTTHIISGNHDLSFLQSDGYDIVAAIAKQRDDFNYLGHYGAFVNINGVTFYLHHGAGGASYARSYKLQKLIEQLAPENKPNVLIVGHYHITCTLKMYRNVYGIMAGCFEAQTPFLRRLGLYPEVGFTILEITSDDNGIIKIKDEWIPFYRPINKDY